jgi:hypothetical protein
MVVRIKPLGSIRLPVGIIGVCRWEVQPGRAGPGLKKQPRHKIGSDKSITVAYWVAGIKVPGNVAP